MKYFYEKYNFIFSRTDRGLKNARIFAWISAFRCFQFSARCSQKEFSWRDYIVWYLISLFFSIFYTAVWSGLKSRSEFLKLKQILSTLLLKLCKILCKIFLILQIKKNPWTFESILRMPCKPAGMILKRTLFQNVH